MGAARAGARTAPERRSAALALRLTPSRAKLPYVNDQRLRELERRFRATGALADEVAWLQARVQTGALDPLRLELAARLGHPAAGSILPDSARAPLVLPPLGELIRFGPALPLRAGLVAVQLAPPSSRREDEASVVDAVARWLEAPSRATVAQVREAGRVPADWQGGACRSEKHLALSESVATLALGGCEYARLQELGHPDLAELEAARLGGSAVRHTVNEEARRMRAERRIPPRPSTFTGPRTRAAIRAWTDEFGADWRTVEAEAETRVASRIREALCAWALGGP